jgi:glycosyltransferase involved in cell wall biosynthesis
MKILHVVESCRGGVGSYLADLLPLQAASLGPGNVQVLAPLEHVDQLGASGDWRLSPYRRRGRSPLALCLLATQIRRRVRQFKPDIIHAHSTIAGLAVRLLYGAGSSPPAVVYCPHGWAFDVDAPRWKVRLVALLEKWLAGRCCAIVAVSRHEARAADLIGIPRHRVTLVLSGICPAQHQPPAPWDDSRLKVLFVGRLDHQKGLDVLLEAVEPLVSQLCLRVAGAAVAGREPLPPPHPHVEMLGWLSPAEVDAQLRAADVVVVPSRWEGLGLAAIEAMRAGVMVVASDIGGLREVVEHGVTGRLVQPGSAHLLRKALLADAPPARAVMGRQGRTRYLERFTAERMNGEILALYERVGQVMRAQASIDASKPRRTFGETRSRAAGPVPPPAR